MHADDLLIALKDPEKIANCSLNDHKFKLKGTEAIKYHLGCNFFYDNKSILYFMPKENIEKMISAFKCTFSHKRNDAL